MPQRLVVSAETGGLGNRLKSWVSAMRLGDDVRVRWAVGSNMPARFDDLFANGCAVDAVPAGADVYASWRLAILPPDEQHLPRGFATASASTPALRKGMGKAWWTLTGRRTDRYRFMPYPKSFSRRSTRTDGRHIDFEFERIPQYFRGVYGPLFRAIAPRPEIVRVVDQWGAANLGARSIGVQVRTWRDDPHRYRKYHLPAWRRLLRRLDAVDADVALFVVSDSDDVVAELTQRYGAGRVLHYARRTARLKSWHTVDGVTEDLIDLLLLARTSRLFVTYISTFGEVAWWLGGASASVEVF